MHETGKKRRSKPTEIPGGNSGSCEPEATRKLTGISRTESVMDTSFVLQEDICRRFEIIRELGSGGFGRVVLARDVLLDRLVAVKAVRSRHPTEAASDRCLAEARAIARLRHPNIVSVHDVRRHGNYLLIVLEYVEGTTLRDRLRQGPLSPEEAARILIQVADAVHFSHRNGIVHRDLKPENILLGPDGTVKVTDFGCALLEDSRNATEGQRVGTPTYMAPEQVEGPLGHADGRADVWALGVILYEALSGRRPFSGSSKTDVFRQILTQDPPPLRQINKEIPPELEDLCVRCLRKNIDERLPTAQDFRNELERFLVASQQRRYRRIRSLTRTVATLVCAVVITVGTLLSLSRLTAPSARQTDGLQRGVSVGTMTSLTGDSGRPLRPDAIQLLLRPPEPLVFAWGDPAEHEYRYSPVGRRLEVKTRRWTIFSLGETPGDDFTLHCTILFKPGRGRSRYNPSHMAVFWGLSPHQDPEEGQQLIAPAVGVTYYGSAHELEASLMSFTLQPLGQAACYLRGWGRHRTTRIPWDGRQLVKFDLYVESGRLISASIQGRRIEKDLKRPRNVAWEAPRRGRLGIALLGGEFTVVDAVVVPGGWDVTP